MICTTHTHAHKHPHAHNTRTKTRHHMTALLLCKHILAYVHTAWLLYVCMCVYVSLEFRARISTCTHLWVFAFFFSSVSSFSVWFLKRDSGGSMRALLIEHCTLSTPSPAIPKPTPRRQPTQLAPETLEIAALFAFGKLYNLLFQLLRLTCQINNGADTNRSPLLILGLRANAAVCMVLMICCVRAQEVFEIKSRHMCKHICLNTLLR